MEKLIVVLIIALSGSLYAEDNQDVQFQNFKISDVESVKQVFSGSDKSAFASAPQVQEGLGQDWSEDSPLFQEILKELQNSYEKIGKEQTDQLFNNNILISVGQYNNIGFSWKKPFATFSINVRRQVVPYLFDERWLVKDEFEISIDASTLISNLKEQGLLDINQTQYGAFAGVTFSRVYRYSHFANTYSEGLTKHFDKLFLAFTKFRRGALVTLDPYDIIEKEDYLSAQAGAVGNVPVLTTGYASISAQAGALVRYSRIGHVWAQAVAPDELSEPAEKIRISSEKTRSTEIGISAAVQADFLNLLRITLLSYDFSYKFLEAYKTNISFREQDLAHLTSDGEIGQEVNKVLRGGKGNVDVLAPFIVSEESRIDQMKKSRFLIFLLGNSKSAETQQIQVVKNGVKQTFFEHNFEKMRYVQNPLSRLLGAILKSLFKINPQVANLTSETKKVHIEYEDSRDLLKVKEILNVSNKEKLSLAFDTRLFAVKTTGWTGKKFRKFASRKLASYRGLDPAIAQKVADQELVGPMEIHHRILLDQKGVRNFHAIERDAFVSLATKVCDDSDYVSEGCVDELSSKYDSYRAGLAKIPVDESMKSACGWKSEFDRGGFRALFHARAKKVALDCIENLRKRSPDQMMAQIPVWKLKDFVLALYAVTDKKEHFDSLFGQSNVFLYGDFTAKTQNGLDFMTNFREGVFTGLGVVESQAYIGNSRNIASVP